MSLGRNETCMGSFEIAKEKERLGKERRGKIGFCLGNLWLIEGESLASQKLNKLERALASRIAKSGENQPFE